MNTIRFADDCMRKRKGRQMQARKQFINIDIINEWKNMTIEILII